MHSVFNLSNILVVFFNSNKKNRIINRSVPYFAADDITIFCENFNFYYKPYS